MKHPLLLMLAFCLALTQISYSQNEYNTSFDNDFIRMMYYPNQNAPLKKGGKILYDVINPNGKNAEKYVKSFDSDGNLISYIHLNRTNDTIEKGAFSFLEKGKMKQSDIYKKSKLKKSTTFTYDKNNQLISFEIKNGKNKTLSLARWTINKINGKDRVTESVLYKRDTSKIKFKWVYDFNEDGSQSKSTLFNGTSKVKKVWSYQCNPEGEKTETKQNEVKICKNSYTDDQYLVYTRRFVDNKGRITKTITKYTAKDSLPIESCNFNEFDSLVYRNVYDKSWDKLISSTSYDKKGKKTVEFLYSYENGNQTSYSFSIGKKLKYKSIMKYNIDNQLIEEQDYDSNGTLFRTIKLTYES
jgi:hypothetical protein